MCFGLGNQVLSFSLSPTRPSAVASASREASHAKETMPHSPGPPRGIPSLGFSPRWQGQNLSGFPHGHVCLHTVPQPPTWKQPPGTARQGLFPGPPTSKGTGDRLPRPEPPTFKLHTSFFGGPQVRREVQAEQRGPGIGRCHGAPAPRGPRPPEDSPVGGDTGRGLRGLGRKNRGLWYHPEGIKMWEFTSAGPAPLPQTLPALASRVTWVAARP